MSFILLLIPRVHHSKTRASQKHNARDSKKHSQFFRCRFADFRLPARICDSVLCATTPAFSSWTWFSLCWVWYTWYSLEKCRQFILWAGNRSKPQLLPKGASQPRSLAQPNHAVWLNARDFHHYQNRLERPNIKNRPLGGVGGGSIGVVGVGIGSGVFGIGSGVGLTTGSDGCTPEIRWLIWACTSSKWFSTGFALRAAFNQASPSWDCFWLFRRSVISFCTVLNGLTLAGLRSLTITITVSLPSLMFLVNLTFRMVVNRDRKSVV